MSKEKRRVPKLRFPGFTEDWEQCKLNEFLSVSNLKNTEDKYNKKDVLSVSGDYGIVNQIEFQGRSFAGVSVSNYGVVETGDIVYTKSPLKLNPYGIIKTNRINNGIVSTLYAIYKTKENCDSKFIEHYFNLDSRLNKYLKPLVNKGAKNDMKVSSENALIGEVCFPHITEQKLIADFLDWLDVYITLHQRKLEHLNLKKKALLQKLFPKDGERYPELRFPGFTDAWEQRKLSELATMNARIGWQNLRTSEFLDSGDYLLITGTDFDNGRIKYGTCHYVEKKRFDQDTKIQLSTGSILITKDGTLGKVALVEELPKPATLNAGVFNVRVKDDAVLSYKYLYHYLKAPFLMKYVTANATGGTIKHLNQSILVDFPIPITEKLEQDRIAKLLDSLELSITLHQRKLEDLQLQKKALLQQMFV